MEVKNKAYKTITSKTVLYASCECVLPSFFRQLEYSISTCIFSIQLFETTLKSK